MRITGTVSTQNILMSRLAATTLAMRGNDAMVVATFATLSMRSTLANATRVAVAGTAMVAMNLGNAVRGVGVVAMVLAVAVAGSIPGSPAVTTAH